MTKKKKEKPEPSPAVSARASTKKVDPAEAALQWVTRQKNKILIGAVGVVLVGAVMYSARSQSDRRERFAEGELNVARMTINSGNVSLAAVDLARVVNDHAGTQAGQEAAILLAKVRLLEGNADLAVSELSVFLSSGPDRHFRSPAGALMANAYEELGQFGEASNAYEQAAADSPYSLIKAQYLLEAGRTAALAQATDRAVQLFRQVIEENEGEAVAQEARLRLGEVNPTGSV